MNRDWTVAELIMRVEELEDRLLPFARAAAGFPDSRSDDSYVFSTITANLSVGDFRAAQRALRLA